MAIVVIYVCYGIAGLSGYDYNGIKTVSSYASSLSHHAIVCKLYYLNYLHFRSRLADNIHKR